MLFKKLVRCLVRAKLNSVCFSCKYETSALYVTGDKAQETYSVLVPYLDMETKFKNLEKLEQNITLRGMNIHVQSLKKLWELYKITEHDKNILEGRRVEIAHKIKELQEVGGKETEQEIAKYMLQGKMVKEDFKVLMKGLWGLEKQAVIRALALPNDLDDDTPSRHEKLVHEFGNKQICSSVRKISSEASVLMNLVDYSDPSCYYLSSDVALFELEIQYYFAEELQKNDFIQFSNADFAWSIVVEGCGLDHRDPNVVFMLENDDDSAQPNPDHRLHLVGGASLVSFCAFHAKHFVEHDALPLKFFTLGRKYEPSRSLEESSKGTIYDSWQASAVELFVAAQDDDAAKQEFSVALEVIVSLYEKLGYHFRVVYLPPHLLHVWESLRASLQMYLPSKKSYVEVANLSISNSYISKRLLMCYSKNKQEKPFLSLVSGTVLSVPKILACMTENSAVENKPFPYLPRI